MSKFANQQLSLAENFQYYLGKTVLGRALVSLIVGSRVSNYLQLSWLPSKRLTSTIHNTVTIPGNKNAGIVARSWKTASIISIDKAAVAALEKQHLNTCEAVVFILDGIPHVGVKDGRGAILSENNRGKLVFAARERRDPIDFSVGRYDDQEKHFYGCEALIQVESSGVSLSDLPANIRLI